MTTQTPATAEIDKWPRVRFSQIFDSGSGSERKTHNSAGVESGYPDPVPPLVHGSSRAFVHDSSNAGAHDSSHEFVHESRMHSYTTPRIRSYPVPRWHSSTIPRAQSHTAPPPISSLGPLTPFELVQGHSESSLVQVGSDTTCEWGVWHHGH